MSPLGRSCFLRWSKLPQKIFINYIKFAHCFGSAVTVFFSYFATLLALRSTLTGSPNISGSSGVKTGFVHLGKWQSVMPYGLDGMIDVCIDYRNL